MINMSKCGGKVPVYTTAGTLDVKLVDFPSRELFNSLFKTTPSETRNRYWDVLQFRTKGNTLAESGKLHGLTRERVRQIESKFIRKLSDHYFKQ